MSHEFRLARKVVVDLGAPLSHQEHEVNVTASARLMGRPPAHTFEEMRDAVSNARIAEAIDIVFGVGKDAGFLMVAKDAADIYVPPDGQCEYRILGGTPALDVGWRIDNNELTIYIGPAPEWMAPLKDPGAHASEILWQFEVAPSSFVEKVAEAVDAMTKVIGSSIEVAGIGPDAKLVESTASYSRLLIAARRAVEASNSLFTRDRPIPSSERRPLMKAIADEYARGNLSLGRSIVMPYFTFSDDKPFIEMREWLSGEVIGRRQLLDAEAFNVNLALGEPSDASVLNTRAAMEPVAIPMHLATSSLLKKEGALLRGSGIRPLVLANAGDISFLNNLRPEEIPAEEMLEI